MPSVLTLLSPRNSDVAGTPVRRLLPSAAVRMVGPFIFLDHMGPVELASGHGIDIGPHPHIGLATVTVLFEGSLVHRDSLGSIQEIRPGDINWMTAGRGIVHSERSPVGERTTGARLHGLQIWVALPQAHEQDAPSFQHCPRESLPQLESAGSKVTVLAGHGFGLQSPVQTLSSLCYADLRLFAGGSLALPVEHAERAVYVISGDVQVDGTEIPCGQLAVLAPEQATCLGSREGAHAMLLAGNPLEGPRHVWWNFVASSRELIEQARRDWADDRLGSIPGESGRIPLPLR